MSSTVIEAPVAPGSGEPEPSRREQTKAANRTAILDAARGVFAELGYESTTVRDIIRRTDLASGTFYNYFKSKEEVFHALHDDGLNRFRPMLRAAYETAGDAFEVFLEAAFRAYFRFLLEDPPTHVIQDKPDWTRVRFDTPESLAMFDELRGYLLHYGTDGGPLAGVDTELLTAASIGMAQEMGERLLRGYSGPDEAVRFAVGMVLGGVWWIKRGNGA
jgi:AcrR family transcriptional regulator